MNHRDRLLTAARSCLLERGYARTTARDLVAASGANLASIAYHFGSKDALLTEALIALNEEWGRELFRVLDIDRSGTDPRGAAVNLWDRVIGSVRTHQALWVVNFESVPYVLRDSRIRELNAAGQRSARPALARAFGGLDDSADEAEISAVGAHYYSLLVGVALQWITDPDAAPVAEQIVGADTRFG